MPRARRIRSTRRERHIFVDYELFKTIAELFC